MGFISEGRALVALEIFQDVKNYSFTSAVKSLAWAP